jgi:signal transduction histidine kinase
VRVTIEDTGPGIAAEHLPHLFERFYRVDMARSREEGGSGLGLAIAHTIVVAHGGTIEVTSDVGHGTKVMVTLPAA